MSAPTEQEVAAVLAALAAQRRPAEPSTYETWRQARIAARRDRHALRGTTRAQ